MNKPRIGIYGSVPPGTAIFDTITSILGYDPFKVAEVKPDPTISKVCGRAKTFGGHFTIYDIFTPTDYASVLQYLKTAAKNFQPFNFTFTDFVGLVRGDYQGGSTYSSNQKTLLALHPDQNVKVNFEKIHKTITTGIQAFRQKIEPEFDKEIFRNVPGLWKLITTYGTPYVFENYSPHLSLASALDGSDQTLDKLIAYLNKNYRDKLINQPTVFDKIYVFEEILDGQFSGYFKVTDTVPLG